MSEEREKTCTVGDLRQQGSLCESGRRVVLVIKDSTTGKAESVPYKVVRCYPDTTDENGEWNSTFKIEVEEDHPIEIKVRYDDDSSRYSDFLDEDEFGTFVAGHRRANLGKLNGEEGVQFMRDLPEGCLKIPIYAYDHSGIVMSVTPFSDPWDSGQVGWWVFTTEDLISIYNEDTEDTRQKAREGVKAQIQYLNDLGSGNVWGYEITGADGDVDDSCWGFVGDDAVLDMKGHIPDGLHAKLEEAWENRFS